MLAFVQLVVGTSALVAPVSFHQSFPWLRDGWASAFGPYNQHLVMDAGTAFFATGIVLGVAACWLQRPVVLTALIAYLGHAIPHMIFHLGQPGPGLPLPDQIANVLALGSGVVVAFLLLLGWLRVPSERVELGEQCACHASAEP